MSAKPQDKCLYCELPPYAKRLCRRHYKKMLAIKNGTYKKDYQRRKKDPAFMEKKRLMDKIYRERIKKGIPTGRKTDDNALVNQDWQKYAKQWREKTQYNKYKAVRTTNLYYERRNKIIEHYSGGTNSCKHCGVADRRVLDIDHIDNNGAQHRRDINQLNIVWWIVKNNFPKGFQILCKNCNFIKEIEKRDIEFRERNSVI